MREDGCGASLESEPSTRDPEPRTPSCTQPLRNAHSGGRRTQLNVIQDEVKLYLTVHSPMPKILSAKKPQHCMPILIPFEAPFTQRTLAPFAFTSSDERNTVVYSS